MTRRQGGIYWCRGTEAQQNCQAEYNLSKQEKSLLAACEVGAGGPVAGGRVTLGILHGDVRVPVGTENLLASWQVRGRCTPRHPAHCLESDFKNLCYEANWVDYLLKE